MFERIEPIVTPTVMINELSAYRKNGMKLTASAKFCQTQVAGISVGGKTVSSGFDLTALTNIQ